MSTLTGERWLALSPLLDESLDMSAEERAPWLARLRSENAELAADLEGLLGQRDELDRDGFLSGAVVTMSPEASLAGTQVGALVAAMGEFTIVGEPARMSEK